MISMNRNNRGFTLVETMVAIVISAILIAAASATYIAQGRSYSAQENVSEVNTQAKMAHDLIARTLRAAPFTYDPTSEDVPNIMFAGFSSSDVVTPTDGTITFSGKDAITIITAVNIGQMWPVGSTGLSQACDTGDDPAVDPGQFNADFVPASNNPMLPAAGSFLLLGGKEFAVVAAYNPSSSPNLTFTKEIGKEHWLSDTDGDDICDTGRPVYMLIDTTFCVDGANNLRRIRLGSDPITCGGPLPGPTNEIIAENIEDMQFAYAIDSIPSDGIIDGSTINMLDGTDFMSMVPPVNYAGIRAVRINILGRSARPDPNFAGQGNPPPAIENNVLAPTNDSFKRRWYQSIVVIRNLEGVI